MRLATSQGGSPGSMPSMRRSSIDEAAAAEMHAEPADRHLAIEPVAASAFGARLEQRARDRCVSGRHHQDRDDHADRDGKPPAVAIRPAARRDNGGPHAPRSTRPPED